MKQLKDFKYIAFGITNQCFDGYVLPFFDYDNDDLPNIVLELLSLQNTFELSNIYILRSTNGYNAFSLDKLTFDRLKAIYNNSKLIDTQFIKWGLNRGFMTLRMGNDKSLLMTLTSKFKPIPFYLKSLPHKKFFIDIMEFKIKDESNFDNEGQITITMFPSNKHGIEKELLDV